jgi:DNA-binding MarR family transcriptional regulator/ribosomal protein S18 acetylase RimI-like enzyme
MQSVAPIIKMRTFNRFYTNLLGLLDRRLLNTEFSITEARVLYELGESPCSARALIQKLKIDSGYLSRILKQFEKKGLVGRIQSKEDGRVYSVFLTVSGKETLSRLNALSDSQAEKLLRNLPQARQEELASAMDFVQCALSGEQGEIRIRHELRPGDAGELIRMHGWIYASECGYNHVFEAYVCKTLYDFLKEYDPAKDRIWFAEADGKTVGAIAIAGHPEHTAQLRWFILHPDFRGRGLGKQLLNKALGFSRDAGYQSVFLETTDDQKTAVSMYRKAGFRLIKETEDAAWGVRHKEQTYVLNLRTAPVETVIG